MSANRIRDIDFWRGAVLIAILIDHIPGNPLENWTPRNFGLSDSAEAFVFLSGLSVGLIYLPRAFKYGLEPVAGGCLKRALKLYGVHIALTVAALVGVRRGLLGERRAGPDPGAWTRFRLRLAGQWAFGARPAQPSARLFQYPAVVYRADAVGAGCGRARAARPAVGADAFRLVSMRPRALSASICRIGPSPAAGSSIRSLGSSCSRLASCRRFCGATVCRGPPPWLVALERRDGRGRRADRDQRGRPRARAARHGDRAS